MGYLSLSLCILALLAISHSITASHVAASSPTRNADTTAPTSSAASRLGAPATLTRPFAKAAIKASLIFNSTQSYQAIINKAFRPDLDCNRGKCLVRITVTSQKFIRLEIIKKVLQALKKLPNFMVWETDTKLYKIVRTDKNRFTVSIPFRKTRCDLKKCVTTVVVTSKTFRRHLIIRRAIQIIRSSPDFSTIFISKNSKAKLIRIGKSRYIVFFTLLRTSMLA